MEKRHRRPLTASHYKRIFEKWKSASRRFLKPGHDYFTEFLAKLDCVTVPKGETLQTAFERAKRREPPPKVLIVCNQGVRLLASLCRELQETFGDRPIMLHQMSIAKLFGHGDHRNISNWIKVCKTLGLLRVAEPGRQGKATRYFYVE